MWSKLIQEIVAKGWSEAKIAKRVGCTQPAINRLKRGLRKDTPYTLGDALVQLHREVTQQSE